MLNIGDHNHPYNHPYNHPQSLLIHHYPYPNIIQWPFTSKTERFLDANEVPGWITEADVEAIFQEAGDIQPGRPWDVQGTNGKTNEGTVKDDDWRNILKGLKTSISSILQVLSCWVIFFFFAILCFLRHAEPFFWLLKPGLSWEVTKKPLRSMKLKTADWGAIAFIRRAIASILPHLQLLYRLATCSSLMPQFFMNSGIVGSWSVHVMFMYFSQFGALLSFCPCKTEWISENLARRWTYHDSWSFPW